MLISITESCHMGCKHCMDDAIPCNKHMDFNTFKDAIDFFNKYGGIECIITGGEPTDNPDWMKMVQYAVENVTGSTGDNNFSHITLTTNAMNIVNDSNAKDFLLFHIRKSNKKLSVQITSVDEYYPIKLDFSDPFFDETVIANYITAIYPQGRALKNNLKWNSKCSKCFNIRSLVRFSHNLNIATITLTSKMKFCTPQIDYQGYIKLGESCLCPRASSIYKPIDEIVNDICNFQCRNCDHINKQLPDPYLNSIGEKRENMK